MRFPQEAGLTEPAAPFSACFLMNRLWRRCRKFVWVLAIERSGINNWRSSLADRRRRLCIFMGKLLRLFGDLLERNMLDPSPDQADRYHAHESND